MEAKLIDNYEILRTFLEKNNHYLFHTPEFANFISKAFSCRYIFCVAAENNEIKTVLPIVEVKSKIFGNRIISSGYIEYGGFSGCAEGILPILNFLKEKYSIDYEYLEIRGGTEELDKELSKYLIKNNQYKCFVLDLRSMPHSSGKIINNEKKENHFKGLNNVQFTSGNVEAVWKKIQKSKRKAINRGLEQLDICELTINDLPAFYKLYCENMRRFGSPPYSSNYFELFFTHLVDKCFGKIYGAFHEGKLVAALLGFTYIDRIHILIAVSDPHYKEYRPSDAVHWKFIEYACQNGYKYFDFGRVREESGQFEYKQKWGPELLDLPSYFLLWKSKEIPFVDPHSDKYKLATTVWKKLPLIITQKIGPRLRKELGI